MCARIDRVVRNASVQRANLGKGTDKEIPRVPSKKKKLNFAN